MSFGDTVSLTVDSTAKTVVLKFLDSHFGLAGAISSAYTVQADGSWLAQGFSAVANSGAPATLTSTLLSAIRLRLHSETNLITGTLEKLPNLKRADGSLLQGEIVASNLGAASLSAVAGTYSFVRQSTGYKADGSVAAPTAVAYGQLKVAADGSVRVCDSTAYSDSCSGGQTGTLAADADQANYPGALVLTLAGSRVGRVVVAARSGATTLSVDAYAGASDGSSTTGTWLLQSAATAAASTALDGEWLCAEPEVLSTGLPSGRTLRHYVTVAGGTLQTDTVDTDISLSANTVNGLFTGTWADTKANARAFVPLSAGTVYYVGNTGSTTATAGAFSGVCHALPAQATVSTYLSAPTTGTAVMTITLADARPTQPAIGYDQVYYKQARYRNTANSSTQYRKEFDDWCEAAGLTDAKSKSVVLGTSKINDSSTFTCSGSSTALDTASMKSAVVGPKGLLYLTDGHHSFTSFWHAPDGGGSTVKIPLVMKGNYSSYTNAAFWRAMRAAKTVWLKNPDGTAITPADLPTQLGIGNGLQDDPYRSLIYFTRDVGYSQPANSTEFLEFYWAEWLKAAPQSIDLSKYTLTDATSYLSAIRAAATDMVGTADTTIIGSSGKTALEMGKLAAFSETEFATLNTATTEAKPGKLAYALAYRASLAAAATK
ncbi:hypothetical protein GT347_10630 [Xylophilus rhododendri]|uniref:ParB-like nuclease n=1 Tax=Xylophilus rhododendri TaxID=2697032 RepID=A0A857J5P5_9BURK|nr:ParB/Srx family N-terminal domain-containing protein [Xylophilus rhododendri]QHI98409.1 hypothetical protein GT347_10630 [Xylophilus rhododendri]